MACVSPTLAKRPTISQVVAELKECLAIHELARTEEGHEREPTNSIGMIDTNLTEVNPLAR
ncbi:hypothetical protein FH972_003625 [Carpinus fangiana]|uniref:Serine-threonine/tyrosine-protein kinase catalytic domain-containing protein n=1 Tax=Carpinus fangiana TaxID=176857 RepID=A0A5N6QIJ4_9ROSI|nr:hypothetical protein FH972_003625 [Carpinus fangiana]